MEVDIHINKQDIEELENRILKLSESLGDKEVRKILGKAGNIYIKLARANAPRLTEPKYIYRTDKIFSKKRAPKGYGKKIATIMPGNLGRSIKKIPLRRAKRSLLIGLKRSRSGLQGVYSGARADGYYGSMVEGGTKTAAPKPFLAPSWIASKSSVLQSIETQLKEKINQSV